LFAIYKVSLEKSVYVRRALIWVVYVLLDCPLNIEFRSLTDMIHTYWEHPNV